MKPKKLLFAGSHAGSTAIALVQEIITQKLGWDISWVGKKWATEDKKLYTLEYNNLPKLGIKFYELESGKIQTKFTRYTIPALLKVPFGFLKAAYLVLKIKPDVVLTFGGAAGAEVAFWGYVFGIPVIVHEQTSVAGRANLFASKFAKKVAISRLTSKEFFPRSKTVLTGNPIYQSIINAKQRTVSKPTRLLITGGSRGSDRINEAVVQIIPDLLKRFQITFQVGEANIAKFRIKHANLKLFGQLDPFKWGELILNSDMVISRAGANVVAELIALKKPCILIPIPWTYNDEQTKNAIYSKEFGVATVLLQSELSPARLKLEINNLVNNYSKITKSIKGKTSPDVNASSNIIEILKRYV